MENRKIQKQLFWRRIPAEGRLGIGLAAFVMGIMFVLFQSAALSAAQTEDEKGDVKRGQEVFEKRCTGCHSLDEDKEGPRLRAVYGKKAAVLAIPSLLIHAFGAVKRANWTRPALPPGAQVETPQGSN